MPQAIAHCSELADRPIELIGFRGEHLSIDADFPVGREHARDLVEREPGSVAFEPFVHGPEVRFNAACWLVSARAPESTNQ